MIKKIIWANAFILGALLLESTILSSLALYIYAKPDLALCILVFTAYVNGTMAGQLTGFFSGFLTDFFSSAPLGLNALVRTLTGALAGLIRGTFFLDALFLPAALCAAATLFKALAYFLLHFLFGGNVPSYDFFALTFWIELALNTVLAPPLFAFLKLFQPLLVVQNGKS